MISTIKHICLSSIGFTGMLLTLQFFLIFIFSMQYSRRHTFRAFWLIHLSYPIFFILMLLHGAGRMIQAPYTYYFVLGPFILFAIDQLISVSRRKIEIPVVSAKLLPSGKRIMLKNILITGESFRGEGLGSMKSSKIYDFNFLKSYF